MAVKVAINGFGRIGRLAFRLMQDNKDFEIVALNDLTDAESLAYLLKYDTAQGRYKQDSISFEGSSIIVDGKEVKVYAERDPENLPWAALGVDVVLECTGFFTSKEKASKHIKAGAKKVVISAPASGDVKTVVYNVNHETLDGTEEIISAASCTTNCLAPMAKALDDAFGIVRGYMTTIHAYTNDQNTLDGPHAKGIHGRRARAAAENIVPTTTGAAAAVGLVLPNLKGRLDGMALRVPTVTGSAVDFVVELKKKVTIAEVNAAMKAAANESFGYTEDPIVSSDTIGMHFGSLFDAQSTSLLETDGNQLIKVLAWYDNEMSYVAQMVHTIKYLALGK
ncbi:type I glyceraldehyde-3-phosphate dehydrogenase [Liberiplasma polymorphum]|uniref:type I glyceraldehyde-3-phosphate dehydrogenase n=1 Tax=Liberiplasma polymorphum TaxID=3374570 RepID=UPI00377472B0